MTISIGSFINLLRNEKGLSMRELSSISGVSTTAISRLEAGQRQHPSIETLKALSVALDVEYGDLMKAAGYIEEKTEQDGFYELVFRDEKGDIVDVKRGVKEMFRRDAEWANIAFRVSRELTEDDRKMLGYIAEQFLILKRKDSRE